MDAYFVGGLGDSPMGAISIVFPLGQVVVGLGLMFGNGAASYLSRLLGQGDRDTANRAASTALYSSVLIGGGLIVFAVVFLRPVLALLSQNLWYQWNPLCAADCGCVFGCDYYFSCELKVCSTKKPWNPTAPPALPAVPELSALCVIRAPALKGGKNVSENNA